MVEPYAGKSNLQLCKVPKNSESVRECPVTILLPLSTVCSHEMTPLSICGNLLNGRECLNAINNKSAL